VGCACSLFFLKQTTIKQVIGVYIEFIHKNSSPETLLEASKEEVRELIKPLVLHNQQSNYLIEQTRLVVKGSDKGILCDREALRQPPGVCD
jgi:endonuclease III